MWSSRRAALLLLLLDVCAGGPHNDQAIFQPSDGLLSGAPFDTALKIPRPPAGRTTHRVVLEVPQGIEDVRSDAKPGWSVHRAPGQLIFQSSDSAETALEFQLRIGAGCDFSNASQAIDMSGLRVLLWRTAQQLRSEGGNSSSDETLFWMPWTSVTSHSACGGGRKGMMWLGRFVDAEEGHGKDRLEEMVVGLEEDRTFDGSDLRRHDHFFDHRKTGMHGGHAGMHFGSPVLGERKAPIHHNWRKIQEAIGTLGVILFCLLLGSVAIVVATTAWAKLLFFTSTARQALLKDRYSPAAAGFTEESVNSGDEDFAEAQTIGKRRVLGY